MLKAKGQLNPAVRDAQKCLTALNVKDNDVTETLDIWNSSYLYPISAFLRKANT